LSPRCRAKARPGELAGKKRFVVVREFAVVAGREKDFALVFERGGIWSDLVGSCSNGYCGCELVGLGPERFEGRDYWTSHLEFEAFRDRRQKEIELFRMWVEGKQLIEREKVLGLFYLDERGFDEGTGLVSA